MTNPAPDYGQLPPSVPLEDTVAHQVNVEERYGGPGGGGDVTGIAVADADGD